MFINCTSLTTINIPDSVTSIGSSAFSGCTNLTTINFAGSGSANSGGNDVHYDLKIYVPAGSVQTYKNTSGKWNAYSDYIFSIP